MSQQPAGAVAAASSATPLPSWVKPMTIGGIVDIALKIYRRSFFPFFVIGMAAAAPGLIQGILVPSAHMPGSTPGALGAAAALTTAVTGILAWFVGIWAVGTLTYLASECFLGRKTDAASAAGKGMQLFSAVLWAAMIFALVIGGPLVLGVALAGGVGVALFKTGPALGIGIGGAIAVLIVIFVVVVAVNATLFYQTLVIEGKRGYDSLRRSRQLMRERSQKGLFRNNVWRISLVYLVLGALWLGVTVIAFLPAMLYPMATLGMGTEPAWLMALTQVGQFALQSFAYPISIVTLTVFYYDIRIRGEGLDMSLKAAAMNPATPMR